MGYFMVVFFLFKLIDHFTVVRANSPHFGLAIWELLTDFQNNFLSLTKDSVRFSKLICRYFISFFQEVYLIGELKLLKMYYFLCLKPEYIIIY